MDDLDDVAGLEPFGGDEMAIFAQVRAKFHGSGLFLTGDFANDVKTGGGLAETLSDEVERNTATGRKLSRLAVFTFDELDAKREFLVGGSTAHALQLGNGNASVNDAANIGKSDIAAGIGRGGVVGRQFIGAGLTIFGAYTQGDHLLCKIRKQLVFARKGLGTQNKSFRCYYCITDCLKSQWLKLPVAS